MNPRLPLALAKQSLVDRFERVSGWLYGDECVIECRKVSAVLTRYSHVCCSLYHRDEAEGVKAIPPKTLAIVERAKVEGQFGSAYTCQECIAKAELELA